MSGPWTVSRRVTVVVGLVVLLVSVFIALTVSLTARRVLLDRVDDDLEVFAARALTISAERGTPEASDDGYQPFARITLDLDGTVLSEQAAGFPDAPEPLPDLGTLTSSDLTTAGLRTVEATDQAGSVRIVIRQSPGGYEVMATSLDAVDAASRKAMGTSLGLGLLAASVGIAVTSLVVRRGFRPINTMIDTAQAIADGDLSQRTDLVESSTELGRLSTALDHMLARIEKSDTERLAEAERVRRFADDASHELRTPISVISGYVELYHDGGIPPGAGMDRAMSRITEAVDRAGRLIEDLLALAKLDQEIGGNRVQLDLGALLADIAEDARVSTGREIHCEVRGRVLVIGDGMWLRQAIDNLVANAVAYTPSPTPIELTAEVENDVTRLAVTDHGPGIAEADRERVFDRFARPDDSRSRSQGGTGLGLAIVREVVASHDGTVSITETVGGGTTVQILLPSPRADS